MPEQEVSSPERARFDLGKSLKPSFVQPKSKPIMPDEVTVVIPTLDEAEGIGKVLGELKQEGFPNVLVVDGYSTDGTPDKAKQMGAEVVMQHGPGKAGALKTAIEIVNTPFMLVMDGDGTYSPADIRQLLAYARDYDEVIGARTEGRKNIPMINRFGNWVISEVFKLFFSDPVTDVLSGMYVLNTEKARGLALTSASFDIEVELASAMTSEGTVTQVPISYGKRFGKQKLRTRTGGRILSTLFWMAYYYNPVFLFGMVVALLAFPAIGILLWVLFEGVFLGLWHSAYATFGMVLLVISTQAASVALVSILLKRSETRVMTRLSRMRD